MNLDFESKLDTQSLSGVTLAGDSEVKLEHKELYDDGSNFYWRIRIITPTTRRFSRKHEISANISCKYLPITISDFHDFVNTRCPSAQGTPFELKCSVWLNSPYAIMPKRFSDDLPFEPRSWDERSESYDAEKTRYKRLIDGCRKFATQRPTEAVVFELKVVLGKEAGVTSNGASLPWKKFLDFPIFNPGFSAQPIAVSKGRSTAY